MEWRDEEVDGGARCIARVVVDASDAQDLAQLLTCTSPQVLTVGAARRVCSYMESIHSIG